MFVPSVVLAQQLRTGTLLEDGRVVVRIFVTMPPDPGMTSGQPIPNVRLLLSGAENRYTAMTDGAGTATVFALPGAYRVASLDSVDWRGRRYRWDVPIVVKPGMGVLDLTPTNAVSTDLPGALARAQREADARANGTLASPSRRVGLAPKNPGTAQVLSFLITGLGQIYAGEAGKGVGLLLAGSTATALAINAYASSDDESDDDSDAEAAIFGLTALGIWIYSIADADDAVERWNLRNGFVSTPRPILEVGRNTVRIGAALTF
jgi:hypothetical protein